MTEEQAGLWAASSDFERELEEACRAGDRSRAWSLLMGAQLVMPRTQEAHEGTETTRWATYQEAGRTFIAVFTSFETMQLAMPAIEYGGITQLDELAARWPDPTWNLAINPGLEIAFYLEPGMVARLAAPPLEILDNPEACWSMVFQKVLSVADAEQMVRDGTRTVSGYCQSIWDVEHIRSPRVLVTAVGLDADELLDEYGAVCVLRWRPIGVRLYANAYGGETPQARDAVAGTIVEDAPFRGLGFVPNEKEIIRDYKAAHAPLPTGAEIWELSDTDERRVAMLDLSAGGWRLIARADDVHTTDAPRMMPPRPTEDDEW